MDMITCKVCDKKVPLTNLPLHELSRPHLENVKNPKEPIEEPTNFICDICDAEVPISNLQLHETSKPHLDALETIRKIGSLDMMEDMPEDAISFDTDIDDQHDYSGYADDPISTGHNDDSISAQDLEAINRLLEEDDMDAPRPNVMERLIDPVPYNQMSIDEELARSLASMRN